MSEIYEELYERLINEGIDDSTATAVVNRMYEAEELHDVEVLDEGLFKAATVIGKVAAKAMGFGKVSARAARGAGASTLRTLNRRGSEAFQRGVRRRNWTPDRALPATTSGQPFVSRMAQGLEKAKKAATGGVGANPATPVAGRTVKALPGAGATASRQNTAAQRLRDAATGTTGTRTIVGRSKDFPTLSGRVRNALAAAGGTTATALKQGTKSLVKGTGTAVKGAGKLVNPVTAAAGGALIGYSMSGGGSKPVADTKPDTAPTTPPGGVVADKGKKDDTKGPGGYTIPDAAVPKTRLDAALTGIKPGAGVPSREDELKAIRDKAKADTIAKRKNRPFDIRDRDIRARAQYDPRFDKRRK